MNDIASDLKDKIDRAVKFMKSCLADGEPTTAHAFAWNKDGGLTLIAVANDCMTSWRSKTDLSLMLAHEVFELGGPLIFVSDGWHTTPMTREERAKLPSNMGLWPKHLRKEALLVFVSVMGEKGRSFELPYSRDAANKPVWGKETIELIDGSGRFSFDLTSRNLDSVIRNITNFGREGNVTN